MLERLTKKESAGYDLKALNGKWCNHYCQEQRIETCTECGIWEAIQKLAYYEDLAEQGKINYDQPKFILEEDKIIDTTFIPKSCRGCSNHPSNGGSGICNCTLGQFKIT